MEFSDLPLFSGVPELVAKMVDPNLPDVPSRERVAAFLEAGGWLRATAGDGDFDAAAEAAEARRRFEFVMARLTHSQHELFALIMAGMLREQIAAELGVGKSDLSIRENRLMKKIRKVLKGMSNPPPRFAD